MLGSVYVAVSFFVCSHLLHAAVLVETKPSSSANGLKEAIESGAWDSYQLNVPVERNGTASTIKLNRASFTQLSSTNQEKLTESLTQYYTGNSNASYATWVYTQQNDLKSEPAMIRLGVGFDTLAPSVWSEKLLSTYAQKWAKKWSTFDGPNCYHTSVASIMQEWDTARYMGPQELLCHQRTYFDPIEKLEQWGDMISLDDSNGVPVHAFTYLGIDHAEPSRKIVFTKNGYRVSPFLYMSYDEVYRVYESYGVKSVRYFRPKTGVTIPDPKTHTDSPCRSYFDSAQWSKPRDAGDALLEYRLRTQPLPKVTLQ